MVLLRSSVPTSSSRRLIHPISSYLCRCPPRRLLQQPAALTQFLNDLSSHSDLQETSDEKKPDYPDPIDLDENSRRSDASQFGSTRKPIIKLPPDLIAGVQELVQSVTHRSTIRTSALGLYGKYRMTSSKESLDKSNDDLLESFLADPEVQAQKKLVKPKLRTTYDHLTSISFAAGAMPSAYGATLRVLLDLKRRLNSDQIRRGLQNQWAPKSILDYGSGTGSAVWSALQVWPDSIKQYTALDKSRSMIWLNQNLLENRSNQNSIGQNTSQTSNLKTNFITITIAPTDAQKLSHSLNDSEDVIRQVEKLDSEQSSSLDIDLNPPKDDWIDDPNGLLAIMAFTLTDLPNQAARREAIEGMWNSGAEVLVIIDRGTPAGFQLVAEARQQLLMLGRRQIRHATRAQSSNDTVKPAPSSDGQMTDELENGPIKVDPIQNSTDSKLGSWVLAPCAHDKPCPLHLSDNPRHFCHFSQRIERPEFLKLTKHTSIHEEDAKYSYVVISRGQRPPLQSLSTLDLASRSGVVQDQEFCKGDALEWPRIVLPPLKRKGHVVFDVCAPTGQIERLTVPRSQGKQAYYDARKTFWGDLWPHGSKKPALVKSLQGRNRNRGDRRRKKKEYLAQSS